jgi:hypothetical protein
VHLHRASQKLGATSRLEAISMALRAGLIRAPSGGQANLGPGPLANEG